MKLSREHLDKLKTAEYKEYKKLERRDFDNEEPGCLLYIFVHIIFYLIVATYFGYDFRQTWINHIPAIFLSIYPGCIPTIFIAVLLCAVYKPLLRKTNAYSKYKNQQSKFSPIEIELRKQIGDYFNFGVKNLTDEINDRISKNMRFSTLFQNLKSNHSFIEEANKVIGGLYGVAVYRRKYKKYLRGKIYDFNDAVPKSSVTFNQTQTIHRTPRSTPHPEPSAVSTKPNIKPVNKTDKTINVNLVDGIYTTDKPIKNTNEKRLSNSEDKPQIKSQTDSKRKTTTQPRTPTEKVTNEPPQVKNNADVSKGVLDEIKTIPTPTSRKPRSTNEGIIKASPSFYRKLADQKMEIGEKGELLAMEYEKKRLRKEKGSIKEIEHTSKVKGDGYGYDIRSVENQVEIYIEVKTTTGAFFSNLFFTQRELDAMNKYDKNYYLYRIYDFDTATNTGTLYIFRGKDEIISAFNFKPTTYKLEPKNAD